MSDPIHAIRDMVGREAAISLSEAWRRLSDALAGRVVGDEEIALEEALDRITSQDIVSPENLPIHPRSTMDGFAVRAADTFGATERMPAYLGVSGEIRMGEVPDKTVGVGNCIRIWTGGYLPPGADAVLMLEQTVAVDERMIEVVCAVTAGENVIHPGEDIQAGEVAVAAGRRLRPAELGILAGLGISRVRVRRPVRVGIISTGDEIVPFHATPPPGKIRDINAMHLSALCRRLGAQPICHGIVEDEEASLRVSVERALESDDVILLSGSSSVGARDAGARVLDSFGPPGVMIHGVSIKPGKPVIVAFGNGKPMFGLPGHPVSAAVTFELLVRPAIEALSGLVRKNLPDRLTVRARLARNVSSAAGRRDVVRVALRPSAEGGWVAHPVLGKSGAISTLSRADGYIVIDEIRQGLREGEEADVLLLS